ncbi:hypothetical protein MRS76_05055 [Rhizobiaceae bacterium n13]|uniref:Uncharacterized protein n=1 Tax=Ferirhizobium litorale TaxID=2927786 RepID=A0AAE3U2W5_9HYPH|nr:hypothetical protein [Fererhizobium litorale]MDI7861317.1 hypothetical protein [Fererhizobium litorale]MDI7921464.1 hypothetical protein [Fererhizobium litorale]
MKPLFLLVLFGLALSGCGESYSWNQKLTVVVETPAGTKSASSVTTARLKNKSGRFVPPEAGGASFSLKGEAVVLEVRPGKYLFALLKDLPRAYVLFYPDQKSGLAGARALENAPVGQAIELPADKYPMMVTFTDITDAASVREVRPNNLEEFFGSGVKLKSLALTITDEALTTDKVEGVVEWAGSPPERPVLPYLEPHDFSLAARLRISDFNRR